MMVAIDDNELNESNQNLAAIRKVLRNCAAGSSRLLNEHTKAHYYIAHTTGWQELLPSIRGDATRWYSETSAYDGHTAPLYLARRFRVATHTFRESKME